MRRRRRAARAEGGQADESRQGFEDADGEDGAPARRLSAPRVLMALLLLAGAAYGGFFAVRSRVEAPAAATPSTWFAPYVDATLTPTYSFQSHAADPARQVVLGFVVSDPGSACTPSWGAAYSLSGADRSLALGARVAELRQEGAGAIVSFGGQDHTELAVACPTAAALTGAYRSVIERYHLSTIDLDVEGPALADAGANQRRAAAVRALQVAARRRHRRLQVWLTLPVEPSGLQANAIAVIDAMLRHRVDLAGVNVMAMDFSRAPAPGKSMLASVERSIYSAKGQLAAELGRYGVHLDAAAIWRRLGVTVTIGQNKVAGERFTVADARELKRFATEVGLGRVSMWSLNRDRQCGSAFPESGVVSNTCSGTSQSPLAFSRLFSLLPGAASDAPASGTSAVPPVPDTNPANAPYPLWAPAIPYEGEYKVVRRGYIYQAKWYNLGQDPATQVQYSWQSPWELLGPVLPSDHAPQLATLPAGTYPQWSLSTGYPAGARVLYQGLGYQAKWYNEGASPASEPADPSGSPWKPLFSIPGEPARP
ncbi:MAG: chitinase [Acidimicrobiales bacterium]